MGATHSQEDSLSHDLRSKGKSNLQSSKENRASGNYANQRISERQKKTKGKPSPPSRIKFLHVTNNSITLSWQAPQQTDGNSIIAYTVEAAALGPGRDGLWRTLTTACQGTTYEARHLQPDTDYVFRVRAENVYGVGKQSFPSEICTTKIFEVLPDLRLVGGQHCYNGNLDESAHVMKRHYSFNMHVNRGVRSILSHSDIILESSTATSNNSEKSQKTHTILRNNIHRTSLPSNRKMSAPLLLPGTRNNSLNRLRESRKSLRTDTLSKTDLTLKTDSLANTDLTSNTDILSKTDLTLKTDALSNTCSSDTPSLNIDIVEKTDLPVAKLKMYSRDSGVSGLRESLTVFDSITLDIHASANSGDIHKEESQDLTSLLPVESNESFTHSIDRDSGKGSKHSLCDSGKISDNHVVSNNFYVTDISQTVSLRVDSYNISNELSIMSNKNDKIINENTDDIYNMKEKLKQLEFCDRKPNVFDQTDQGNQFSEVLFATSDSQKEYYESLENPWERNMAMNSVSQQILAAPLTDDAKMALYARNLPDEQRTKPDQPLAGANVREATDFRILRSMLKSNDMIVKTTRSLPDVVFCGEGRTTSKEKLFTIIDAEEEADAVRITTL